MTVPNTLRQMLERIAPHLETLSPIDREMIRPAVRAFEADVEVIPVPERVAAILRKVDAQLPK